MITSAITVTGTTDVFLLPHYESPERSFVHPRCSARPIRRVRPSVEQQQQRQHQQVRGLLDYSPLFVSPNQHYYQQHHHPLAGSCRQTIALPKIPRQLLTTVRVVAGGVDSGITMKEDADEKESSTNSIKLSVPMDKRKWTAELIRKGRPWRTFLCGHFKPAERRGRANDFGWGNESESGHGLCHLTKQQQQQGGQREDSLAVGIYICNQWPKAGWRTTIYNCHPKHVIYCYNFLHIIAQLYFTFSSFGGAREDMLLTRLINRHEVAY